MIQTLIGIILMPFAALSVVFTGAIGVGLVKGIYETLFKKNSK